MRELLKGCRVLLHLRGITPAYAGTTNTVYCDCCGSEDHPRVCGNYVERFGTKRDRLGSPPRMRELLQY